MNYPRSNRGQFYPVTTPGLLPNPSHLVTAPAHLVFHDQTGTAVPVPYLLNSSAAYGLYDIL